MTTSSDAQDAMKRYSYGPNAPAPEIARTNSNDPRWHDVCGRCGYARINQRHGPPPRTMALPGTPTECVFKEPADAE